MDEKRQLDALLDAVSRGAVVDWERTRDGAGSTDARRRIANLHVIAEVGRCARGGTPPEPDAEPQDPERAPERWGDLTILEPIGAGSFASVHRAWDGRLRRHVALKLFAAGADAVTRERALAEARLLARVEHPSVVTVHGVAIHGDRAGMWMSLAEGIDLRRRVEEEGPLEPERACRVGIAIASALEAVHRAGVVHRDVKAQNVIECAGDRVVLADFGVGAARTSSDTSAARLRGTPLYLAPELLDGDAAASPRTDVYALGVLLFFLLTGRHPVEGAALSEVLNGLRHGGRSTLAQLRPGLPDALVDAVERALSPDPGDRTPDAATMEASLRAALETLETHPPAADLQPREPRRRFRVLIAGGVALAAAALLVITSPWRTGLRVELSASDGSSTRALADGDTISWRDRLRLSIEVPEERFVYALNIDPTGGATLMFPIESWVVANPLPVGRTELPGTREGRKQAWTMSPDRGLETFFVVVSETPLGDLESALAGVPAVTTGGGVSVRPADAAVLAGLTRGVSGMADLSISGDPGGGEESVTATLLSLVERGGVRDGVEVRVIRLSNEGP